MNPNTQAGNAQQEPPATNPADPQDPGTQQGSQADPGPKQGPDDAQKLKRIENERDSWKTKYEDLQKQIEEAGKADDKDAEIERLKNEAATSKADLERQLADGCKAARIDVMLASGGCRDIDMARSAIDMSKVTVADDGTVSGFDVEEFAKSKACRPPKFGGSFNRDFYECFLRRSSIKLIEEGNLIIRYRRSSQGFLFIAEHLYDVFDVFFRITEVRCLFHKLLTCHSVICTIHKLATAF